MPERHFVGFCCSERYGERMTMTALHNINQISNPFDCNLRHIRTKHYTMIFGLKAKKHILASQRKS